MHAAVAPRAGHKAAYFSMFHSPTSVDNRSVRLGRVVMFLITMACAVFVERGLVQWVVSCGVGVSCTSRPAFAGGIAALLHQAGWGDAGIQEANNSRNNVSTYLRCVRRGDTM